MDSVSPAFATELARCQSGVYAYILTLVHDRVAAQDILQDVNLTALQKAAEFTEGTNFFSWASRIAYFHVLRYRRKQGKDRLVFTDDVLDYLAERQADRFEEVGQRAGALKFCLEKLSGKQRELLEQRYAEGGSVLRMAQANGQSVGAISQSLYRIRESLLMCIEKKLASESG